jgi:hypothetical protein
MKIIKAEDVINAILDRKEVCTFYDINTYREEYRTIDPDAYLEIDRDSVLWAIDTNLDTLYWDKKTEGTNGENMIRRQEILICPFCGEHTYYKYPNTEKFELIKKMIEDYNNRNK